MKKLLIILAVLLLGTIKVFSQEQVTKSINRWMQIGEETYNSGNYKAAIKYFTKIRIYIEKRAKRQNVDIYFPLYFRSRAYASSSYWELGIRDIAIQIDETTIELYKLLKVEDPQNYVISLERLAWFYQDIGNFANARKLLQQALEVTINELGENHYNYTTSLHNLAVCCIKLGDYTQAIESFKQILDIQKVTVGDKHPDYAHTLNALAESYYGIGDYIQAIEMYEQAIDIQKITIGDKHLDYAHTLNGLAVCHNTLGNYAQAIELHKQTLEIKKAVLGENHPSYAVSLGNLSGCYWDIGEYFQAIELAFSALDIYKVTLGDNNPTYALLLDNLATYCSGIGLLSKAIELNELALGIYKGARGDNHPDYARILNNLAVCYNKLGDYAQAIELHKQALKIIQVTLGENHLDYANSLNNLASCYENIGDYTTAIELNKQTLEIMKVALGENHPKYASDLNNLAFKYYIVNEFNDITPVWSKWYKTIKACTFSLFRELTSEQRYTFWNHQTSLCTVISNNIFTKALSNDKQSMGLSYNSLLFSKGVILASDIEFDKVIRESGDTVLLEKFEELRTTRAILNTYYNKPIAERPEGEVERLEARAEVLEKDLLDGSKEYADFTRRLEIEWQDVQAALGDKDVAIEILAADEHIDEDTPPYYAALVLRKGWDAPKFVELCGAEELQTYFDSDNGLAMMYREANSRKLYDLIWGKLAEHINEGDNVYFSPGGLLHQVNVELLQDTDGRLANEKYNLHRVSSTRELCFETPKIAHSEAVLYGGLMYDMDSTAMVAQSRAVRPEEEHYAMRGLQLDSLRGKLNYLSASKTEVEKISKQMSQHGIKTTLYVEQIGNEESFKALSGKKTPIIHLATHGFFFKNEEAKVKPFFRMMSMDQERPRPDNSLRRSGLAFAGAQKAWDGEEIPKGIDDGVMLAQEIASMDLAGTDLVVLSACETGLGEINSEGVFGLQRAFKKAGVQTLIMSLWKVHDEATALFMQTFYGNLLSGKSKRDSFAAAQMALREHRDYGKDPAYWAAFVMLD